MKFTRGLVMGGVAVYVGAAGATYLAMSGGSKSDAPSSSPAASPSSSPTLTTSGSKQGCTDPVWTRIASEYDSKISMDETVIGVDLFRRFLCRHAQGSVLEVSAGTGRNIHLLAHRADQLTLADRNENMLHVAEEKLAALPEEQQSIVRTVVAPVEHLPFPDASFDTVVDTFGLCSCDDPDAALREMQRVCKPDGTVLLLEHGRSSYDWLSRILDRSAPGHAATWGCWWNRDVAAAMEHAGFRDLYMFRWHFGTTVYAVAKPGVRQEASSSSSIVA